MYNVQNYINKLEELKEWDFPFERFKHIEEVKKEEAKEEPKVEEIKDDGTTDVVEQLQKPKKKIRLDTVVEGGGESKDVEGMRRLLKGFEVLNVHFHFIAEQDITKLHTKSKYQGLFDIGVLSLWSAGYMKSKEFSSLFKHKAPVHVESADFIIALKKENRVEYRKKLIEAA
jgi:hypothetical protein